MSNMTVRSVFQLSSVLGTALLLSGCFSPFFSDSGSDSGLAQASTAQADANQSVPSALPVIATECPPVRVLKGAEAYTIYTPGQSGNSNGLQYQAVISEHSRNCVVSNGLITVKMGIVGRLLTGPAGKPGTVQVPVRFAVQRNELAVFSEKYMLPVTIVPPNQAQDFVKVVEDVTIPYLGGEDITIWVGFDPS